MNGGQHKPVLIVIAGPNGSGKTSVTTQILQHEWMESAFYINPDNSAQNRAAKLLFRISNGRLYKQYETKIPEWAQFIYDATTR